MKVQHYSSVKTQRGLSLIGMVLIAILLGGALLLGMKTVPVYSEYLAVKRIINDLGQDAKNDAVTNKQLRDSFELKMQVAYSDLVGKDLIINGRGIKRRVGVRYDRKVPLIGNASLLFEFHTSNIQAL